MIEVIAHVGSNEPSEFHRCLEQRVTEFNQKNLAVEVQYTHDNGIYSALVIGREQG